MNISINLACAPLSDAQILEVQELGRLVFGQYMEDEGNWRFRQMPDFTLHAARSEGVLIGFKLGYAHTPTKYYSWLGAVHLKFRRKGIARELMSAQHSWCSERGYLSVETSARQSNHGMSKLNLDNGFKVVGIKYRGEDPDIVYEKALK